MSDIGTTRTFRNVRSSAAVGCKADMKCSVRAFPLSTQSGRPRPPLTSLRQIASIGVPATGMDRIFRLSPAFQERPNVKDTAL
jgi:hypothetical protein